MILDLTAQEAELLYRLLRKELEFSEEFLSENFVEDVNEELVWQGRLIALITKLGNAPQPQVG